MMFVAQHSNEPKSCLDWGVKYNQLRFPSLTYLSLFPEGREAEVVPEEEEGGGGTTTDEEEEERREETGRFPPPTTASVIP